MRVPFKKSTVRDVAARAGVSQSAVSHYINGRVNVCSPETALRINRVIEELHFTPARALRHQGRQATNTIGICVSLPTEDVAYSSYLHRFWTGISGVVDQQGYRIMHFPRSMRNSESCSPFLDGGIDGLLISAPQEYKRLDVLADAGLPTVCVNRLHNLPRACGAVVTRESDVVDLAMTHLWELGHRRIGFVGAAIGSGFVVGPYLGLSSETAVNRYQHWTKWCERSSTNPGDYAVFANDFDYIPLLYAQVAVDRLLALPSPPTAIFCASDRIAISVIDALKVRSVRVPEDISIVGVDNESTSAMYDPSITSVDPPIREVGRQAVQMLIDMCKGTGSPQVIEIPVTQIVVRSSTARCNS